MKIFLCLLIYLCCASTASANFELEAAYPYTLDKSAVNTVAGNSTAPLYINIKNYDNAAEEPVIISVKLPKGFNAAGGKDWTINNEERLVFSKRVLPKDFGFTFDLLYIKPEGDIEDGEKIITVKVSGDTFNKEKEIKFFYKNAGDDESKTIRNIPKIDKRDFNWYIQGVTLPVDESGVKDDRTADNVIYVRNVSLEAFRNRIMGDGATNWSAVFSHPATHLLLDMRNPQQDIRLLKFKAELLDKTTGEVTPGLCAASKADDEEAQRWNAAAEANNAATAMISLDGNKTQTFILPLYVDYFKVIEGSYTLRVTVSSGGQEKIQEVPIIIEQKHGVGVFAVGFSLVCLALILINISKLRECIALIGAQGAVTVSLFAAIAFGGISVPTTMLAEFLHVFLGPFSGFFTGVLSGIFQYLLLIALLILYRRRGVAALMFLIKFMLSGVLFGRFTPLGLLSCCVYIVVLETVLMALGFYEKKDVKASYMLLISLAMGLADALITFINMEQMMFLYRLYYADWYIGSYMLINGFLYSAIGSRAGFKLGVKLRQITGE